MWELLFLLLPFAFLSGWFFGKKLQETTLKRNVKKLTHNYFSGLNYLLDEQPDKAVAEFLQAINLDDELIETHLALGNLFRRKGEVARSIRIHQALLARPSLDKSLKNLAYFELGKDFIAAGMLDRAEEIFIHLSDKGEKQEASQRYLLEIYQQEKDWQQALRVAKELQRTIKQDLSPTIAQFYCELAAVELNNTNVAKFRQYLFLALKTNAKCVRASILLGNMYFSTKKYKKALVEFQRVYRQDPAYIGEVLPLIAKCYTELEVEDEVYINYLESCIKQVPTQQIALCLADKISQQQSNESAVRYISKYLQKQPTIYGLSKVVALYKEQSHTILATAMQNLQQIIDSMLHDKPQYKCQDCGLGVRQLEWQCPGCKQWESIKFSSSTA